MYSPEGADWEMESSYYLGRINRPRPGTLPGTISVSGSNLSRPLRSGLTEDKTSNLNFLGL